MDELISRYQSERAYEFVEKKYCLRFGDFLVYFQRQSHPTMELVDTHART